MNTEEEELFHKNIGLAYDIAFKYNCKTNYKIELDDLQSISFIGLMKACKTYKKQLGYAFSTYAYNVIQNEIRKYLKNNQNYLNQASLDDNLGNSDNEFTLEDIIPIEQDFDTNLDINYLYECINDLPENYKLTILYSLQGFSKVEIGKLLGLSKQRIGAIYDKSINILRYKFRDRKEYY